jgi:tocopherol O-methyltransferase
MTTTSDAWDGTGTAPERRSLIERYYDETQVLYSRVWSPTGVHYGFWEPGVRTRQEAIVAMDRFVGCELGLAMGSSVLDAGCGVGGTSVFLAEQLQHRVTGITLSRDQLRRANARAARCHAPHLPSFAVRDYLRTDFKPDSFDGVVAIESACHSEVKLDFLREAYRVLKPGGRIVVCDGFLSGEPSARDSRDYREFVAGLAIPNLSRLDAFLSEMAEAGFSGIRVVDKQSEILRSARSIWRLSWIGYLVCLVPCRFGWFPDSWLAHGVAGIRQRRLFEQGVFVYRVVSATKPGTVGFVPQMTS